MSSIVKEEVTNHQRKGFNIRDAIVFLIDWRKPMLEHDPLLSPSGAPSVGDDAKVSLLSICLRIVSEVMKAKIRERNTDMVSVIAFGSGGPPVRSGWPGVRIVRPLRPSDAAGIKRLQALAERLEAGEADRPSHDSHFAASMVDSELHEDADEDFRFGDDDQVEFDKALWAARHQFTTLSAVPHNIFHRKRVFVFTNDDDPSRGTQAVRQLSLTQARDLADMGATMVVTLLALPSHLTETPASPLSGTNSLIDSAGNKALPWPPRFFSPLVYGNDGTAKSSENGSVSVSTVHSFDKLCSMIKRKENTKRAIRITHLTLGDDYKIGIALFALIRKAGRPSKIELVAETNKPVYKITMHTCESVGQTLKPDDIRHFFQADFIKQESKRITEGLADSDSVIHGFSKVELPKAKGLGPTGLVMYGFRDKSYLRKEYILGPPSFVFPDDSKLEGSTKAFAVLHKCMLKRGVIGIVSVRRSDISGSGLRFGALVPQQEKFSDKGEQLIPGGMYLHILPYKDDVYTLWRNELPGGIVKSDEENNEGGGADNGSDLEDIKSERNVLEKSESVLVALKKEEKVLEESESVLIARNMMRKLKLRDYNTHTFANPDLQRFYNGLELAAGVETTYAPDDDLLDPDMEAMEQRAGDLMRKVQQLEAGSYFDADAVANRFGTKSNKRAAETHERKLLRDKERDAKRFKAQAECDDEMFENMSRNGNLNQLVVKELQVYCRAHGLPERGNKKNLILSIEDHLAKRIQQSKANTDNEK